MLPRETGGSRNPEKLPSSAVPHPLLPWGAKALCCWGMGSKPCSAQSTVADHPGRERKRKSLYSQGWGPKPSRSQTEPTPWGRGKAAQTETGWDHREPTASAIGQMSTLLAEQEGRDPSKMNTKCKSDALEDLTWKQNIKLIDASGVRTQKTTKGHRISKFKRSSTPDEMGFPCTGLAEDGYLFAGTNTVQLCLY